MFEIFHEARVTPGAALDSRFAGRAQGQADSLQGCNPRAADWVVTWASSRLLIVVQLHKVERAVGKISNGKMLHGS